jgi:putative transposase
VGQASSVGSKGDSNDNTLAQTINGLYKAEVIHRRSWPTLESVALATLEWMPWFKHQRLLGRIGYISQAQAEADQYRQLASQTPSWRSASNQPASMKPRAVDFLKTPQPSP